MSDITNMTELMSALERVRALLRQREEELATATRALQTMREVNDYDTKYQVELEQQLAAAEARVKEMEELADGVTESYAVAHDRVMLLEEAIRVFIGWYSTGENDGSFRSNINQLQQALTPTERPPA